MNNFNNLIDFDFINKKLNEYNFHIIDKNNFLIKEFLNWLSNLPKKISDQFIFELNNHICTKYHKENLITHLVLTGLLCYHISKTKILNSVNSELAFWCGVLHDIGKPFCRVQKKKYTYYTGHSQIGDYLINNLDLPSICTINLDILSWCINNHMCNLSHNKDHNIYNNSGIAELMLSFIDNDIKDDYINMLIILFTADYLAKDCDELVDYDNTLNHNLKLRYKLLSYTQENLIKNFLCKRKINNNKIIILMYGLSGSGKSYISNFIKSNSEFSTKIIERDQSYVNVYKLNFFEDYENYLDMYNKIGNSNLRGEVQKDWINNLNEALEDNNIKIVIIDSLQTFYPQAWNNTIESLSEDALYIYNNSLKIGLFGFPQHMLDRNYVSKIGEYKSLPQLNDKWIQFPCIFTEKETYTIDYGLGNYKSIIYFIKKFFDVNLEKQIIEQKNLYQIMKLCNNFDDLIKILTDSINYIKYKIEHDDDNYIIYTLYYFDGLQTYNGITRDYRGESLLYDKKNKKFEYLRASLPIFPDFVSISRDNNSELYLDKIQNSEKIKICMTPKYDGSMFNLVYINTKDQLYNILANCLQENRDNHYFKNGLWLLGSKNTVLAFDPVLKRIKNSIVATYKDINKFLDSMFEYVKKLDTNKRITFHFEAIDKNPTPELTILYDENKCIFLGYTLFDNDSKEFRLDTFKGSINNILFCKQLWYNNYIDAIMKYQEIEDDIFNGSNDELEGWVFHIFYLEKWIPIKYKYDFYYIGHKPNKLSYANKVREISENEKYVHIKKRLLKFYDKPSLENIISKYIEIIYDNFDIFNRKENLTRKKWFYYWSENETKLNDIFDDLISELSKHYPKYSNILQKKKFNYIMNLYGTEINKNVMLKKILEMF